ncbi:MAG: protein-L-isoaspartate(D-aspartate) O-methyltransferase [Bacteroidales bacterium]|nr:protein-L-isoaspartate(D-aspartate) O-methyltransferase [Bacteroidales bacterium]
MTAHLQPWIKTCFVLLGVVFICNTNCQPRNGDQYMEERNEMVEFQIKARRIIDKPVLQAMQKVQRHLFVPAEYAHHAYEDTPLPIGFKQTISQPFIVAYMTEALELDENSKVLEIGTGSGYQAAILGEICKQVYTIEIVKPLGEQAAALLKELGYKNIEVKVGDGYKGWAEVAPFDAIIVTCAPTEIPQPLIDQLAEGGRIAIPYGQKYAQRLVVLIKKNGKMKTFKPAIDVRFVPMVGEEGDKY